MGKSKTKKKKWSDSLSEKPIDPGIPIPNLPEKFLCMRVKSGTKIRNVLGYAIKEFPNYNSVVWTAAGHGIGKAITCAELFKRKCEGLHQITKLRYIESEKSKTEKEEKTEAGTRHVPEIHILLTKEIKDKSEPGYQAPGDQGEFLNDQKGENSKRSSRHEAGGNVTCIDAEEFAAMGLRTGQKRPKKEQQVEAPPKKNKRKEKGDQ